MTPIHLLEASRFWDPNIIELIDGIQAILPRDNTAFEWIVGQLLDALDSGRFATAPPV